MTECYKILLYIYFNVNIHLKKLICGMRKVAKRSAFLSDFADFVYADKTIYKELLKCY